MNENVARHLARLRRTKPVPTPELKPHIHENIRDFALYAMRFPLRICACGAECREWEWDLDGPVLCSVCEVTGGPPRTEAPK